MQLLMLQVEDCAGLKQWLRNSKYLSHGIATELVSIMAKSVLRGILSEIWEASFYALLIDEATDIAKKEQICINIRWVDKNFSIHAAPVELIHAPKTDSSTFTLLIKDSFIRFSLPISQCQGQAYDGAASMSGHKTGVAAQIQQEQPLALYVHCLAHCTNLCLQTVGKQSTIIHDALDLVMGLNQLINCSPKRSAIFQSI